MKENKILQVVCLAVIAVITFFFAITSPYRYAYDPSIKQLDNDAFLVLHVWALLIIVLTGTGLFLARGSRLWVYILYAAIAAFVAARVWHLNSLV
ncbi:hypothetical protein [Chitinophaga sp. YIM B06452]|uniref:hypothetical protein n=1 Tax=Chitinophaga sp. YIM B06452 TaxID=3082158 RepID=UPI0031FEB0A9